MVCTSPPVTFHGTLIRYTSAGVHRPPVAVTMYGLQPSAPVQKSFFTHGECKQEILRGSCTHSVMKRSVSAANSYAKHLTRPTKVTRQPSTELLATVPPADCLHRLSKIYLIRHVSTCKEHRYLIYTSISSIYYSILSRGRDDVYVALATGNVHRWLRADVFRDHSLFTSKLHVSMSKPARSAVSIRHILQRQ